MKNKPDRLCIPKTLHVTTADIKKGRPGYGAFCPIALALKRELPDVRGIHVDSRRVRVKWGRVEVVLDLGAPADTFMDRFDMEARHYGLRPSSRLKRIKPRTFRLR